jgi:hypothetical protein
MNKKTTELKARNYPLMITMPDGVNIGIEYVDGKFVLVGNKDKIDDGVGRFFDALINELQTFLQQLVVQAKLEVVEEMNRYINDEVPYSEDTRLMLSKLTELKHTLNEKK